MELLLLGTAAAEGWPAPYCDCPACEDARRRGGPNVRSRSGALIDDDLKIDHNADTVVHMQRERRSLSRVKAILFTHHHSDHFLPAELEWTARPYTNTPPPEPIICFGNELVCEEIRKWCPRPRFNVEPRLIRPLEPARTPQGDAVLPLPADHGHGALVLRITRDGKSVFYGHDSGLYPPQTLDALGDGVRLDIAVFDCTGGGAKTDNRGHMDLYGVLKMVDELCRRGAITSTTRCIATHFSHNGGLPHEDLVRQLLPHGIEPAFDGMIVRV
jgi:phosphoribosyl 1,2-cyclic phosphate phosphodiesterase